MGAYSELDIDRRYGDDPFKEGGSVPSGAEAQVLPAFTEAASVEPAAAPFAEETVVDQPQAEIEDTTPAPSASEQAAPAETSDSTGQTAEAEGGTVSEDDKKKAHEAAEAKRKADWEARQAEKKAAEQEQLARLETMSAEELLSASMKRVSTDTEKLTRRNMKLCVAEYIQTRCVEDPAFARLTMHPAKSMIHCFWYINRKAREYLQEEMKLNDEKPPQGVNGVYGGDVPDDIVYQWAEDYFRDPDAEEDHRDDEKFVPKPYYSGGTPKSKSKEKKKAEKKSAKPKPVPKPKDDDGQFSLLEAAS